MSDPHNTPHGFRNDWTLSPKTAIDHLHTVPPEDQRQLLIQYSRMAGGGDGGQIEAWSLYTVRNVVYPDWSNKDFAAVIAAFATLK